MCATRIAALRCKADKRSCKVPHRNRAHAALPRRGTHHDVRYHIKATILGVTEGLTEFLPVSSTGHLLLLQQFFGFGDEDFGKSFTVLIQFGAVLALLSIYSVRLWQLLSAYSTIQDARRFVIGVLIAFLPAAVIGGDGLQVHQGGAVQSLDRMRLVDRRRRRAPLVDRLNLKPRCHEATLFTLPMYLVIGLPQCLSMIPGVSRSGATIVSAMLLDADRRARRRSSRSGSPCRPWPARSRTISTRATRK